MTDANNDNSIAPAQRIQLGAIGAGILSFIALYALLGVLILFSMAYLPEQFPKAWLDASLKIIGLISWALPGFIAARIAGHTGWLHGALTGVNVGILVALTMTLTFSWEGTLHDSVRDSLIQTFLLAFALCTVGGILVDVLAAQRRRKQRTS